MYIKKDSVVQSALYCSVVYPSLWSSCLSELSLYFPRRKSHQASEFKLNACLICLSKNGSAVAQWVIHINLWVVCITESAVCSNHVLVEHKKNSCLILVLIFLLQCTCWTTHRHFSDTGNAWNPLLVPYLFYCLLLISQFALMKCLPAIRNTFPDCLHVYHLVCKQSLPFVSNCVELSGICHASGRSIREHVHDLQTSSLFVRQKANSKSRFNWHNHVKRS